MSDTGLPGPGSEAALDEELLAAFLDGRLDTADRERVEAWLEASPRAREVLAEAVRILDDPGTGEGGVQGPGGADPGDPDGRSSPGAESGAEGPPSGGSGGAPGSARRFRWWVPVLAAAAVAGILLPFRPPPSTPGDAAPVPPPGLTAMVLAGDRGWSTGRGGEERLTAQERAVRIGALWMALRLELASRGDGSGPAAADLATLLELESGGGVLRAAVAGMLEATDPRERETRAATAHTLLSTTLPSPAFEAGYVLEELRVACAVRSTSHLRDSGIRERVRRVVEQDPEEAIGAALDPLLPLLDGDPPAWNALCPALDDAMGRLGG
jgi:hypothetical protein